MKKLPTFDKITHGEYSYETTCGSSNPDES